MALSPTQIVVVIAGVVLIALMLFLYIRSRGGDTRIVSLASTALLPALSIIVIVLGAIYSRYPATCGGIFTTLLSVGIIGVIILIVIGCVRYVVDRRRSRQALVHAVFFSVILVTIIALIEYLNGCL